MLVTRTSLFNVPFLGAREHSKISGHTKTTGVAIDINSQTSAPHVKTTILLRVRLKWNLVRLLLCNYLS